VDYSSEEEPQEISAEGMDDHEREERKPIDQTDIPSRSRTTVRDEPPSSLEPKRTRVLREVSDGVEMCLTGGLGLLSLLVETLRMASRPVPLCCRATLTHLLSSLRLCLSSRLRTFYDLPRSHVLFVFSSKVNRRRRSGERVTVIPSYIGLVLSLILLTGSPKDYGRRYFAEDIGAGCANWTVLMSTS
jgi:hypothetical protein